ncbi:unnamed protein product [Agarophyton chilense]
MSKKHSTEDPLLAGLSRLSTSHASQTRASRPPRTDPSRPASAPHSANLPPTTEKTSISERQNQSSHPPAPAHSRRRSQSALPTTSSNYPPLKPRTDRHSYPTPHQSQQLPQKQFGNDSSSRQGTISIPHRLSGPEPWGADQPIVPTVMPLNPLHHSEISELIEQATGLGRPIDGDPAAAGRLLQLIKSGSLPPRTICEHVVAGSGPNEVKVNARALWLLHYLMVEGGPLVLPQVVQSSDGRNPPAVKLVLKVLRSYGYETDADGLDVLHDDEKVRNLSFPTDKQVPEDALQKSRGERTYDAAGVETYAIALGRKAWFHYRYSAVEVNYSLDRFYRAWHVENDCDPNRHESNNEIFKLTLSKSALQDMYLLVCAMTAAAQRLQRGKLAFSLCLHALTDACNAYSYALYLRRKVDNRDGQDFDLEPQREVLASMLRRWEQRGGKHLENVLHYVEERVYDLVVGRSSVAVRPESRHRREIEIEVTSFDALHRAFQYLRQRSKCAS